METMQENIQKFDTLNKFHQEWIIDFGMRMADIVDHYAITDDELESISRDVAEYVTYTRIKNLRPLLFDGDRPRFVKDGRVI